MSAQRALRRTGALTVIMAAAAGILWSSSAGANGVIQACYQKENGQLRILQGSQQCRKSEMPISWNAQGPQGDKGDKGDTGDTGPVGVSGLERIVFNSPTDSEPHKEAFAKCPPGKHVVGGGAQVFFRETSTIMGPVAVKTSYPSQAMNGWAASAEEVAPTNLMWHVTAFALCADVMMPTP